MISILYFTAGCGNPTTMLAQQPHTGATEVHKHALFCHQIITYIHTKQQGIKQAIQHFMGFPKNW